MDAWTQWTIHNDDATAPFNGAFVIPSAARDLLLFGAADSRSLAALGMTATIERSEDVRKTNVMRAPR
ncbi:MAG: hypothetical protein ACRECQ_14650, partial [Burkholderiaceae bacterium]